MDAGFALSHARTNPVLGIRSGGRHPSRVAVHRSGFAYHGVGNLEIDAPSHRANSRVAMTSYVSSNKDAGPLLSFDSVTKLYGTVIGVNDLKLDIPRGAHGLLGPNGSGKTTIINLITGQLKPTLGRVRVFGASPWRDQAILGRIGLCPAMDVLHRTITGLQWVTFLMELQGYSRSEAGDRAVDSLRRVGMEHAMQREIGGYSRGMKQRVKLAQAIAHDPEFLILDEPFNGLDPVGRHEMTELLAQWIADGRSLLLASHVLHEVEEVCKSFLLISNGRVLASGSADDVRQMLADVPSEIVIQCDRPKKLARRIFEDDAVDSVTVTQDSIIVSSQRPLRVYEQLPQWCIDSEAEVQEVSAPDETLQALFHSLMKIHRGEVT